VRMPARLGLFMPVVLESRPDGVLAAEPRPTNTSGDFITLAGTDGFVELPRGPEVYERGTAGRLFRRQASEPERHEHRHDVRVEAVERLLARRHARHAKIAEILVVEPDAVVRDVDRAPIDEFPTAAQHVVARADPNRAAVEGAELLVARHEVLEPRAREQILVERGRGLRIEPDLRLEDPAAVERMRVAELEGIGADIPAIRVPAVLAVQRRA